MNIQNSILQYYWLQQIRIPSLKLNNEIHEQNTLHLHPKVFGYVRVIKILDSHYNVSLSRMKTGHNYYTTPNKFALKNGPKFTKNFAQYHYKMVEDATARHTSRGYTLQFNTQGKLFIVQDQTVLFNELRIKINNPFACFKLQ
jgi:hypothetical protein